MANIEIALDHPIRDGETIEFTSAYDSTSVTGLSVTYPVDEEGTKETKTFSFRDAHGNNLTGLANVFSAGAYIKVIVNTADDYAYIQNGDTNAYLETERTALEKKFPLLKYGTALTAGADLNDLIPASSTDEVVGTYYSPNSTISKTVVNSPVTNYAFVLDVMYSTGNDYRYIRQSLRCFNGGDYIRVYSNGTWSNWEKNIRTVDGNSKVEGMLILNSNIFGTELPAAGNVGRLFLVEVS